MPWYRFPGGTLTAKLDQFYGWHTSTCASNGIPRPGDDDDDLANCWTDAYAIAYYLPDRRLVVALEAGDPNAQTLNPTATPTESELEAAVVYENPQPLPPEWNGKPNPRPPNNGRPS